MPNARASVANPKTTNGAAGLENIQVLRFRMETATKTTIPTSMGIMVGANKSRSSIVFSNLEIGFPWT